MAEQRKADLLQVEPALNSSVKELQTSVGEDFDAMKIYVEYMLAHAVSAKVQQLVERWAAAVGATVHEDNARARQEAAHYTAEAAALDEAGAKRYLSEVQPLDEQLQGGFDTLGRRVEHIQTLRLHGDSTGELLQQAERLLPHLRLREIEDELRGLSAKKEGSWQDATALLKDVGEAAAGAGRTSGDDMKELQNVSASISDRLGGELASLHEGMSVWPLKLKGFKSSVEGGNQVLEKDLGVIRDQGGVLAEEATEWGRELQDQAAVAASRVDPRRALRATGQAGEQAATRMRARAEAELGTSNRDREASMAEWEKLMHSPEPMLKLFNANLDLQHGGAELADATGSWGKRSQQVNRELITADQQLKAGSHEGLEKMQRKADTAARGEAMERDALAHAETDMGDNATDTLLKDANAAEEQAKVAGAQLEASQLAYRAQLRQGEQADAGRASRLASETDRLLQEIRDFNYAAEDFSIARSGH